VAIVDAGQVTKSMSLSIPTGATPRLVDLDWQVTHMDLPSLAVTLVLPDATTIVLAQAGSIAGMGAHRASYHLDPGLADSPWNITADDVELVDTLTGSFNFARVSLTYAGGAQPFPLAYRYQSEVRDLGAVTGLRQLRWGIRQARPGATIAVRMRTCDAVEACDAEPWTDAPSGQIPPVASRRFAQFEVAGTSDGDVATAFDFFELDYRVAP
jgi:hypothetical protein